jgi:hypothetical protein
VQTAGWGGLFEGKTCGRFVSYPATNLDVSETRLAFFHTPSMHGTLLVVNRLLLFTVKRCMFRRFVPSKSSLFTIKVVVSAESKSQLLFILEKTMGCRSVRCIVCWSRSSRWTADGHNCLVRVPCVRYQQWQAPWACTGSCHGKT